MNLHFLVWDKKNWALFNYLEKGKYTIWHGNDGALQSYDLITLTANVRLLSIWTSTSSLLTSSYRSPLKSSMLCDSSLPKLSWSDTLNTKFIPRGILCSSSLNLRIGISVTKMYCTFLTSIPMGRDWSAVVAYIKNTKFKSSRVGFEKQVLTIIRSRPRESFVCTRPSGVTLTMPLLRSSSL